MKQLTKTETKTLIEHEEYPCISLYLPIHVPGGDVREDAIRLKNLLNQCQNRLQTELSHKQVENILQPGFDMLRTDAFWKAHNRGLGLFLSPSLFETYHLNREPEEGCTIGRFFHILPLVNSFRDRRYYLLILSQKDVNLVEVNGSRTQSLSLGDLPKTLDEFLQYDVAQEHIQAHTRPMGKSVGTDAQFHGQGNIADDRIRKKNIERYVKQIVKHVDKQLYGRQAPLILAGVDFEQAIFRETSEYRYLLDEGISSKTGQFEMDELQHRAQDLVQSFLQRDVEERIRRYHNQINTDLTAATVEDILPAAFTGRVETLLVDAGQPVYGTFDPATHAVTVRTEPQPGDENLLNLAAVFALRSDATVYRVETGAFADNQPLAAIYRY